MKLMEIKNNLVKLSYDENIALGKFIVLVDENRSYVGQIINLKADIKSNYAIAKLIFSFNSEGIVENYDGTIPSMKAKLSVLPSKEILNLLPIEKPITFGTLTQENTLLKVDQTIFERNLLICAEKFDNICTLIKNCTMQLFERKEKAVVIDTDHTFGEFEPVRFKRDFKLPLNARMIDFIYENDLEEVDATSKAVIQDIFQEVHEYAKTVEFIPIDTFISVVSLQYEQTQIPELALLKNKLLKYKDSRVFAQTADELEGLKIAIDENLLTYIDIADVDDNLQKELIIYIHSVLNDTKSYIYNFVKITNRNSDKKLLLQLLDNNHIFTSIICSHNFKYVPELKQKAENIIFFAPQTNQHDFASYNTFLNKLSANEFVVYGNLTQYVPFIVELNEFSNAREDVSQNIESYSDNNQYTEEPSKETIEETHEEISQEANEETYEEIPETPTYDFSALEELEETTTQEDEIQKDTASEAYDESNNVSAEYFDDNAEQQPTHDELVEQVAKDVDEVFYNKSEEIPSIEEITSNDNLTEDDLDFIDDLSLDDALEFPMSEQEIEPDVQPIETDNTTNNFDLNEQPDDDVKNDEFNEQSFEPQLDDFSTQEVPVYEAESPVLSDAGSSFEQGDIVSHPKYGKGVIEKLIKYGNKTLCSISFENVGRRLLDPAISELTKE